MSEVLDIAMADPGRVYDEALVVRQLIEVARQQVAAFVKIRPRQLLFTSSIAESIETAIRTARKARPSSVVVASALERASVLEAATRSGEVALVDVDRNGIVTAASLTETVMGIGPERVAMVCCQVANHETGAINDVAALLEVARSLEIPTHLDATSALSSEAVDLAQWRPTFTSLSSELIGGPSGIAGLAISAGTFVDPVTVGADQERGRRAGLENVIGIVGFGAAASVLDASNGEQRVREVAKQRNLSEMLLDELADCDRLTLISPLNPESRLASVLCFTVEGIEAEAVVMGLNRKGFAVHSGSACSSEELRPSPVLAAMGLEAARSLRVSFGWSTTEADVTSLAQALRTVVGELGEFSG